MPGPEKEFESTKTRPRKSGTGKISVLVLLAAAGAAFWWSRVPTRGSAEAKDPSPLQSVLHLETFVLNLAGSNERAYLRVGIDLALEQEAKRAQEVVPIAEVRDTILGTLAEAKSDDLMTAGGKAKLKENVLRALRERVPALGAKEIYFTEFLIQR